MWTIYEKKSLLKKVRKIPKVVIQHYEIWKRILEHEGSLGLQKIKGFNDEALKALKGRWLGFRSSGLNKQWRVIYTMKKQVCEVYVIDINAHKYKRG